MTSVQLCAPIATYLHRSYGIRLTYYRTGVVYMLSGIGLVVDSWWVTLEDLADWAKTYGYEREESK